MNTLTVNHSNGNSTIYQLIEGGKDKPIAYHEKTSKDVINAIERARQSRQRIKVYLGDTDTGKCWNEEHDTIGYVGLSKGYDAYYPILVYNKRAYGGGAILDHCIVKIKESKGNMVLFQARNFQQSTFEIKECGLQEKILGYTHSLYIDSESYSNHKSLRSAEILKNKLS